MSEEKVFEFEIGLYIKAKNEEEAFQKIMESGITELDIEDEASIECLGIPLDFKNA